MTPFRVLTCGLLLLSGLAAARMEDRTKELYQAVEANDLAAVRRLLDESDQNVNVARGKGEVSPLMLACQAGNAEMARLLISRGADVAAVDTGGRPVLEYLRKDTLATYKKMRALILEAAAARKITLPLAWEEIWLPDGDGLRAAASYPPVLPARNLTDGDPRTAWAGKAGEEVWLFINAGALSLAVLNGYNKTPALFKANNRVKRLAVSVWAAKHFEGDVSEVAEIFHVARLTPDHVLALKDDGAEQSFALPFRWEEIARADAAALAALVKRRDFQDRQLIHSLYVLRAEPLEVYRGTRYDDTCLSELRAGGKLEIPEIQAP